MNRLKNSLLLFFIAGSMSLAGQQLPHFSQYMFNEFILNPALAGVDDYYQIRTNHRFQWVGMTDPPLTNSISFYGPHPSMDMGFGGSIYSDVTGPTSRTNISGSYGYNIAINQDMRLSMGLSLSLLQYKIDGAQLTPEDPSDMFIQGVVSTSYVPDAGVGVYLYHDDFYVGFSAAQLLNNKLSIFKEKTGLNRLKTHFYVTGAYRFEVDPDWVVEPSAIIKVTAPALYRFEVNAKVEWTKMAWLGVGYRFHDAISIMAGYNYDDKFYFGYAYDIGITDLRKYNSGSHELMIGYRFNDIK
ncbi:MAG: type IX secretion system membrane protein PorP/SprF [Bacteroidales bacterium]|jgi:type IX secretion system PorP/SprF family membrane protein|nr:type IX secretion system membrane protein PorP/SprF [Bacteroidales bacterium]